MNWDRLERWCVYAAIIYFVGRFIEIFEHLVIYSAISSEKFSVLIELMQKSRLFR